MIEYTIERTKRELSKLVLVIVLVCFGLDFAAVWLFDSLKESDNNKRLIELCGNLADPTVLEKYTIGDIHKCPNISGIEMKLKVRVEDDKE